MKPTLEVVIGIVQKDDQVLIVRKADDRPEDSGIVNEEGKKDFLLGLWHFPGGKADGDLRKETVREVFEETNIEVVVGDLLGEITEERDKVFLQISWFACEYKSGEAKPGDDIVETVWIPRTEAVKYCAPAVVAQWPDGVLNLILS